MLNHCQNKSLLGIKLFINIYGSKKWFGMIYYNRFKFEMGLHKTLLWTAIYLYILQAKLMVV